MNVPINTKVPRSVCMHLKSRHNHHKTISFDSYFQVILRSHVCGTWQNHWEKLKILQVDKNGKATEANAICIVNVCVGVVTAFEDGFAPTVENLPGFDRYVGTYGDSTGSYATNAFFFNMFDTEANGLVAQQAAVRSSIFYKGLTSSIDFRWTSLIVIQN